MMETSDHGRAMGGPSLPAWLDRYTTLGQYGLLIGTGLCLVAFVTNLVPDPSFPWATLPESVRLPLEQHRIEHWPVSYTIGSWLWIIGFPALFLAGYRRFGARSPSGSTTWLVGIVSTVLAVQRRTGNDAVLVGFGLLALPLGLPAVYEGYRRSAELADQSG